MQKFVCRQATDVSQLLPLPIPSNSRQERNMTFRLQQQKGGGGGLADDPDARKVVLTWQLALYYCTVPVLIYCIIEGIIRIFDASLIGGSSASR